MREILKDVFTWSWYSEPHGYDFNGYLIRSEDGNLAIDPVSMSDEVLEAITALGIARILITNRNHTRAANRLRAATSAPTAIHESDAEYAEAQGALIDGAFEPGERIGPLNVVAVPGKSPGEVAFHWPVRRILIVGDAVVGDPPGHLGLLREAVMDDPARLRQSVRWLLDLDFDTLLLGDGVSILGAAKLEMKALVDGLPG
jgi:glyoxylase-like metal-dependent hydrolase (beta-lactamase superfamily II)